LSACRTGSARQRSAEPVAGLALALRSAGAREVVLSLWSVDDDATADLMQKFYRPLVKDSADYGHSLSLAKRKMIEEGKWAHPFYWAAFVLQGN
jgi:CHAT domain-containing protein